MSLKPAGYPRCLLSRDTMRHWSGTSNILVVHEVSSHGNDPQPIQYILNTHILVRSK